MSKATRSALLALGIASSALALPPEKDRWIAFETPIRCAGAPPASGNWRSCHLPGNGSRIAPESGGRLEHLSAEHADQGERATTTTYDDLGRAIQTDYPGGSFEEAGFDDGGNQIWRTARRFETEPERLSHTLHDGQNRPWKTWLGGSRSETEPPSGRPFVEMEYDAAGRLVARTDERGNTTTYGYDGAGRRILARHPGSSQGDPNDDVVLETHYDSQGRAWWTWDGHSKKVVFAYDLAGRKTRECRLDDPEDADNEPPPAGACKLFEHDAGGQVTAEIDEEGMRTEFGHDEMGRLTSVTDALGHITSYDFDDEGNMIAQHDALERITHYEFDQMGRRTARVLPLGQREDFAYSLTGAMTSHVDFMRRETAYTLDPDTDRVTEIDYPNDPSVAFTYFGDGQRHTVTIGSENPTEYTPEPLRGKLDRVDHPDGTWIEYDYLWPCQLPSITFADPAFPLSA